MKTTDFDHIIRNAVLQDSEPYSEMQEGKERVWKKISPQKKYRSVQMYVGMLAAAAVTLLLTIGFFMQRPSDAAFLAGRSVKLVPVGFFSTQATNSYSQERIVYRSFFLASETIHDTVFISKSEPVYITVLDTFFLEKEDVVVPSEYYFAEMDEFEKAEEPKEVRGILWWKKKPLYPENVAEVNVPIEGRGGIFMHLFGRNN
ncbi:MAG: hypothetical protein JXR53_00445 [Bacteroidales bacterium]|nr:hypothetical protein [Bacteroidales bacterium]